MAITLPVKMAEAKEAASNFFIELYQVELPSYTLYLAACDEDIVFNGKTYMGYPIKRGEITKTVDSRVDNCDIEISNTNDYFTLAIFNGKNFLGCRCYIYKILYPESLDDASVVSMVFYGQIDSPELTSDATFKCSIVSDLPNMDNCRTMGYSCSAVFGDENCGMTPREQMGGVNLSTMAYQGVDRQVLMDSQLGEYNWDNAVVVIDGIARRVIHYENFMAYLEYPFPTNIDTSGQYYIVQNCDKTPASCRKYNNLQRYGGFPFVPFEFVAKT